MNEDKEELAIDLHNAYESIALGHGWNTQETCKVMFNNLPEKNQKTMIDLAEWIIKRFKAEHEKEIVLQQNNNALLIAKLSKDSEQLKERIKDLEEETKELKKGVASGICANTFRKNTGLSKGGEK